MFPTGLVSTHLAGDVSLTVEGRQELGVENLIGRLVGWIEYLPWLDFILNRISEERTESR